MIALWECWNWPFNESTALRIAPWSVVEPDPFIFPQDIEQTLDIVNAQCGSSTSEVRDREMRRVFVVLMGFVLLLAPEAECKHAGDALEADARAARIVDAMTLEEQISLLQPLGATPNLLLPIDKRASLPAGALGSAGFLPGIPRLGWPALQESDGPLGVANIQGLLRPTDEATAMPSSLAWSATFDPDLIEAAGRVIGEEAHAKGFNVMLSGGLDLARDPRNGRNFEYAGEDPLLAGTTVGSAVAGIQSQHVVSTVKHFAFNDQETGRGVYDVRITEGAARESDLLAFHIAIEKGRPGAVMCAYNKVNGDYSCENEFLLNRVLKGDWKYPGWVMSDWGGVHSLQKAVESGLDQQSPQDKSYFADLRAAVEKGEISRARVREMAFRIVRSMIAVGALDDPAKPGGAINQKSDSDLAQSVAEEGTVLHHFRYCLAGSVYSSGDESADVMAAPHHGARTGLNPKTLLLVNPNTVLISAGVDNSYGHPYGVAVQAYQQIAKHVFCTIAEGGKCLLTRRIGDDFHTHLVPHRTTNQSKPGKAGRMAGER